jgi:hypothetical protein
MSAGTFQGDPNEERNMTGICAPFGRQNGRLAVVWPARVAERRQRRWLREPEPWEAKGEAFAGEMVLRDLEASRDEPSATERIIARYVVTRLLESMRAENARADALARERLIAEQYLSLIAEGDAERRALGTVLQLRAGRTQTRAVAALLAAGSAAASHGHVSGAFRLQRTAYELAVAEGWLAEGARAARSIEQSALRGGGMRSAQLWDRRARVLERRSL